MGFRDVGVKGVPVREFVEAMADGSVAPDGWWIVLYEHHSNDDEPLLFARHDKDDAEYWARRILRDPRVRLAIVAQSDQVMHVMAQHALDEDREWAPDGGYLQ